MKLLFGTLALLAACASAVTACDPAGCIAARAGVVLACGPWNMICKKEVRELACDEAKDNEHHACHDCPKVEYGGNPKFSRDGLSCKFRRRAVLPDEVRMGEETAEDRSCKAVAAARIYPADVNGLVSGLRKMYEGFLKKREQAEGIDDI